MILTTQFRNHQEWSYIIIEVEILSLYIEEQVKATPMSGYELLYELASIVMCFVFVHSVGCFRLVFFQDIKAYYVSKVFLIQTDWLDVNITPERIPRNIQQ